MIIFVFKENLFGKRVWIYEYKDYLKLFLNYFLLLMKFGFFYFILFLDVIFK